jgi:hypothetical protein
VAIERTNEYQQLLLANLSYDEEHLATALLKAVDTYIGGIDSSENRDTSSAKATEIATGFLDLEENSKRFWPSRGISPFYIRYPYNDNRDK